MLAVGASLLVAAGFAGPASSSPAGTKAGKSELRRGGTLRVNIPGTDIDDIDPSIAYGTTTWHIQYSTALKLMNYPDAPAPRGTRLQKDAAASYKVSNNGRTYTFRIKPGFRFSDGTRVTAANFQFALLRAADKELQSPAYQYIEDVVVGAKAVREGRAGRISGVTARGNTLTVRLMKPDPIFLPKMAFPFFQAISRKLPRAKKVINVATRNDLPSAGPYYVATREPSRVVVLKKNTFYRGPRPRNLDQINIKVLVNLESS